MGRLTAAVILLLTAFALLSAGSLGANLSAASGPTAKKRCKTVVKRVHGKKRHVRVCKKVKKGGHGQTTPPPPPPPAAAKTVGQATLPTGISSLAAGGGAVWATLADNRIVRIDPNTLKIVATIPDPLAAEWPPLIAVGAGAVWAADAVPSANNSNDAGDLLRIDPATNTVAARIPTGRSPEGITFAAGSVWAANHRSDTPLGATDPHLFTVSRVDPASNRETGRVVVERRTATQSDPWPHYCCGPQGITAAGGSVWVGDPTPHTVYRIDPATNAVAASIHAPDAGDACGGLAGDDTAIWVASGCDIAALWRIDPMSNAVAATITLPGGAGDVALGFGSVWVTTFSSQFGGGENALVRVDPATNLVVGKTPLNGALAVGEGAIWIGGGNTLFKLAPAA